MMLSIKDKSIFIIDTYILWPLHKKYNEYEHLKKVAR